MNAGLASQSEFLRGVRVVAVTVPSAAPGRLRRAARQMQASGERGGGDGGVLVCRGGW